jgi:hypothetical protein
MSVPDTKPQLSPSSNALELAEARGKQVLLYEPQGVLGGTFSCARCGEVAIQPDLLQHAPNCPYVSGGPSITVLILPGAEAAQCGM